jgi:hypothetical protein
MATECSLKRLRPPSTMSERRRQSKLTEFEKTFSFNPDKLLSDQSLSLVLQTRLFIFHEVHHWSDPACTRTFV